MKNSNLDSPNPRIVDIPASIKVTDVFENENGFGNETFTVEKYCSVPLDWQDVLETSPNTQVSHTFEMKTFESCKKLSKTSIKVRLF